MNRKITKYSVRYKDREQTKVDNKKKNINHWYIARLRDRLKNLKKEHEKYNWKLGINDKNKYNNLPPF